MHHNARHNQQKKKKETSADHGVQSKFCQTKMKSVTRNGLAVNYWMIEKPSVAYKCQPHLKTAQNASNQSPIVPRPQSRSVYIRKHTISRKYRKLGFISPMEYSTKLIMPFLTSQSCKLSYELMNLQQTQYKTKKTLSHNDINDLKILKNNHKKLWVCA